MDDGRTSLLLGHPAFDPCKGHKYSGRNNDGNTTPGEVWYFVKTVLPIVLGFRRESGGGDADGGEFDELEKAAASALGC